MADRVLLKNPSTGDVWECPAEAAEAWQELGWKKATAADEKKVADAAGKEK